MGRALKLVIASSSLLSSCGDEVEAHLPPEVEGAMSLITRLADSTVIIASEFGPALRFEAREEDRYLVLSAYRESLDALDLAPGRVEPLECRSCALRSPIGVFELDTRNPGQPWRRLGEPRDEIMLGVALPDADRCDACARFDFETPTLANGRVLYASIVLPTDGSRALVFDSGVGAAYWATREGPLDPACLASAGTEVAAAYSDGPSSAWTVDGIGRPSRWDLGRLDPTRPCADAVTTLSSSTGEVLEAIDGPPAGAELELFAMGLSGRFHRHAGGRWQTIGDSLDGANRVALWMGPGQGFASTDEGPVQWYQDGQTRIDRVVVDSTDTFISQAKRFDDVGVVFGAKPFLLLFQDGSGGWRRIFDQTPTSDRIDAFTRHRGSYFMILNGGRIQELHPERGYCPFQHLLPETASRHLVALEDGTMFVGAGPLQRIRPIRASACD